MGFEFQAADEETIDQQDLTQPIDAEERLAHELQAEADRQKRGQMIERLEVLGMELAKKRIAAIEAKSNFGIEQEWLEDEETYQGVDDANRGESKFLSSKPTTAGTTVAANAKPTARSNVFLNITRPYTDAAAARIGDIILPTDDRPYSLTPLPIPDMLKGMDDVHTVLMPDGSTVPADQFDNAIDAARHAAADSAERAMTRVDSWLVDCQFPDQARVAIDDWVRLGTGILKGPTPTVKKSRAWLNSAGQMGLVLKDEIKPTTRCVNPMDFFPDPACGENIHDGSYVFERDAITAKGLLDLKGTPGYLPDRIDVCLQEGPALYTATGKVDYSERDSGYRGGDKSKFEIWYFHGLVSEEELEAAGFELPEKPATPDDDSGASVGISTSPALVSSGAVSEQAITGGGAGLRIPAMLTMVNDHVIRAAMHPLDSGEFPYDLVVWQRRSGMPWGAGIPRQMRVPQRMVNAATRNMMDNAGLAAKPISVIFKDLVKKATPGQTLQPGDVYHVSPEALEQGIVDASKAMAFLQVPTLQEELMGIIQFALKMAEDITSMPQLLQGQQGSAPDTVGGMKLLEGNAAGPLRRLAKKWDSSMTEPHIRRYYEYLMMYGPDDSEKQEMTVDAKGSSTFVDRDMEVQFVVQMAQLVQNPAYGIDPKRWFAETCRLRKFDPKKVQYTDAEVKQMSQQPAQPNPEQMKVQGELHVAQLRAQTENQVAQTEAQAALQRAQTEAKAVTDREAMVQQNEIAREQSRSEQARIEMDGKIQLAREEKEKLIVQLAIQERISINQIKADLAQAALEAQTKREIAALDHHAKMVAKNPKALPGDVGKSR